MNLSATLALFIMEFFVMLANFFLAPYFLKLDIAPALLIFIAMLEQDFSSYIYAALAGLFSGFQEGYVFHNVVLFMLVVFLLRWARALVILNRYTFLLVFAFSFLLFKSLIYIFYTCRGSLSISLIVIDILFNMLINAVAAYPLYVMTKKLYTTLLKFYEKSLRYT